MEDVTIPGWAIWLISSYGGITFTWLVFLTLRQSDQGKDIAVNTAHDKNFSDNFIEMKAEVKQQISDIRIEFNTRFDRFEDRCFAMINK